MNRSSSNRHRVRRRKRNAMHCNDNGCIRQSVCLDSRQQEIRTDTTYKHIHTRTQSIRRLLVGSVSSVQSNGIKPWFLRFVVGHIIVRMVCCWWCVIIYLEKVFVEDEGCRPKKNKIMMMPLQRFRMDRNAFFSLDTKLRIQYFCFHSQCIKGLEVVRGRIHN